MGHPRIARGRPPRAHAHQRNGTRIDGSPRAGARARVERTGDAGAALEGSTKGAAGWPPAAEQRIQDEIKADNYQVSGRAPRATGGEQPGAPSGALGALLAPRCRTWTTVFSQHQPGIGLPARPSTTAPHHKEGRWYVGRRARRPRWGPRRWYRIPHPILILAHRKTLVRSAWRAS